MKYLLKNGVQMFIMICLMMTIFNQYRVASTIIVPVTVNDVITENVIKKKLAFIGVKGSDKLVSAIDFASEQNNISHDLIIALTWTESNFNDKAQSCCNGGKYKGLMQIPYAVYYSDANILIGTRILREKLNSAGGDMTKAIMMYKGYPLNSPRGYEQVRKVFALYHKIRRIV